MNIFLTTVEISGPPDALCFFLPGKHGVLGWCGWDYYTLLLCNLAEARWQTRRTWTRWRGWGARRDSLDWNVHGGQWWKRLCHFHFQSQSEQLAMKALRQKGCSHFGIRRSICQDPSLCFPIAQTAERALTALKWAALLTILHAPL